MSTVSSPSSSSLINLLPISRSPQYSIGCSGGIRDLLIGAGLAVCSWFSDEVVSAVGSDVNDDIFYSRVVREVGIMKSALIPEVYALYGKGEVVSDYVAP